MKEISFRNDILPLKDKLFRMALRITMDTAEAEDIVQDTLIKVWSKKEEWNKYNSIEAFCTTICKNLSLDRRAKKDAQTLELNTELHTPADISTPFEYMAAEDSYRILEGIMKDLPDVQQDILQLRDIEGKSYKEIADMLQLTEDKVKVYLFRARQKIKQKYSDIQNYGL